MQQTMRSDQFNPLKPSASQSNPNDRRRDVPGLHENGQNRVILCVASWVLKFIAIKRHDNIMHLAEEYLHQDLLPDILAIEKKFNNYEE